jgi:hypothetical protein
MGARRAGAFVATSDNPRYMRRDINYYAFGREMVTIHSPLLPPLLLTSYVPTGNKSGVVNNGIEGFSLAK